CGGTFFLLLNRSLLVPHAIAQAYVSRALYQRSPSCGESPCPVFSAVHSKRRSMNSGRDIRPLSEMLPPSFVSSYRAHSIWWTKSVDKQFFGWSISDRSS